MWIETHLVAHRHAIAGKFIRQQWRMWIETRCPWPAAAGSCQFIRQQWRMWIETSFWSLICIELGANSFASNGECGLKHVSLYKP